MSNFAIAHVEAAIRHRNLSKRVIFGLIVAGGVVAVGVAAADLWWAKTAASSQGVSSDAVRPAWPDLATKALGHFTFSFLIALLMAAIYEMLVLRHLRAIARQVRSGGWLRRGELIKLHRDWVGASDDLDEVVGALNEARAYGVETRSALAWRIGQQRSVEAGLQADLAAAACENETLRADVSEQADFARLLACDLAASVRAAKSNPGRHVADKPVILENEEQSFPVNSNVMALSRAREVKDRRGDPEDIEELAAEFAAYCAASDGRLSRVALAMQDVIGVAIRDLEPRIAALGASLDVSDLPIVEGDRALLIRLASGLIGDALDAAVPGEPVAIEITALPATDDGRAIIRVRDNCGRIESKRGDGVTVPPLPNRRLRIRALCHRIVRAHGGEMSEHQSDGSTRVVQIELARA